MYFLTTGMTTPRIFLSCMILPKTDGFCPAYDLTYSSSIGGEHATCVNGNGQNPGRKDLLAVAAQAGIEAREAADILKEVEETVRGALHFH